MSDHPYAMLLAAGLGTRLKDLSRERPKPLLPVCNHALLRWVATLCVHHGLDDLVVNLHHLGQQIQAELGDGGDLPARVTYSAEAEILGTGGGIKVMAALRPRSTCVVLNAKIITDLDLTAVVAYHKERKALATMVLYPDPDAERWGAIGLDESGAICRLLTHRRPAKGRPRDFMFTGVHVLEPEFIDTIPDGPCCVIRTAYTQLFQQGAPLAGYLHHGYFHEHSTPQRYLQGNINLLAGLTKPPARPGPLHGVHSTAQIHPTARLIEPILVGAEATIAAQAKVGPYVVLGDQSQVASSIHLDRCVVWPRVSVQRSASSAILTPSTCLDVALPPDGSSS